MEDKRVQWLDIAKGITIILMVLGHTSIPRIASNFIFAFHMPLFFFASGWCTNWNKYSFGDFALKRLKTLAIPFVVYSVIVIILGELIGAEDIRWFVVLCNGWKGYALWFVPVLFFASVIAKAIMTFIKKKRLRYIICAFLILLGVGLRYYHVYLPWALATVPYAICLVLLGSSLKKYQKYIDKPRLWIFVVGLLLTFVISYRWRMDMAWNSIIPVILLTISAVSGTAMMFTLSSYLTKIPKFARFLETIGKETFIVMAFSQILCLTISHYFRCNKLIEYGMMFSILFFIVLMKNGINKILGQKIL